MKCQKRNLWYTPVQGYKLSTCKDSYKKYTPVLLNSAVSAYEFISCFYFVFTCMNEFDNTIDKSFAT